MKRVKFYEKCEKIETKSMNSLNFENFKLL